MKSHPWEGPLPSPQQRPGLSKGPGVFFFHFHGVTPFPHGSYFAHSATGLFRLSSRKSP